MADMAAVETTTAAKVSSPTPTNEGAVVLRPAGAPPAPVRSGEVLTPAGGPAMPRRRKKRVLLPLVLLAALGGGGYEGYRYFVEGRFLVSTDDAYVKADMSIVAA